MTHGGQQLTGFVLARDFDLRGQVTASDGETRIIGVGEIYLVEDLHGKGHLSQGLGKFRHSLMIPID